MLSSREEDFKKEIDQYHYMTKMDMHYHKNPCPRDNEIYNFGRTFLSHHCFYFVCLIDTWE